jgi:hypothetical protein
MRRLLPVLALGLLLLAPPVSPVSPESETTAPPDAGGRADPQRAVEKPADMGEAETGERTPAQRAREFRTQLLAGVELSADQTRRIDEIERDHVLRQTQRLTEMDQLRSEMRRARREGDAERVLEYAGKLREARKGGGRHADWIHEVRQILDLQQQQQFDVNRERIRRESWRRDP